MVLSVKWSKTTNWKLGSGCAEKPIECSWNSCNFTIGIYIMWRVCRATANFQQIKKLYTKQRGICTRVVESFQFNANSLNSSRRFAMRKWISSVKRKQTRCLKKRRRNHRARSRFCLIKDRERERERKKAKRTENGNAFIKIICN